MVENIDSKECEQHAYMSYHEDGLLDLSVGLPILLGGLNILLDSGVYLVAPVAGSQEVHHPPAYARRQSL